VKTDLWGRTSLPGLYSAGETADTGVHGANRLASNSLLEGLVFGARAGQAMMKDAPISKRSKMTLPGSPAPKPGESAAVPAAPKAEKLTPAAAALKNIREIMWNKVGILRSGKDLAEALRLLNAMELPRTETPGRTEHELRNLHGLATLIARSGLAREESRGSHYRSDFPFRDDEKFQKHSVVSKGEEVRFEL
jgi:L-aspartate oxidase